MSGSPALSDVPLPLAYARPFTVDGVASPHRQLILKSAMAGAYAERIDIGFRGVDAVCLAFDLAAIEVATPTGPQVEVAAQIFGERARKAQRTGELFVVTDGGRDGFVIASAAYVSVNSLHGANASPLLDDLDGALGAGPVRRLRHRAFTG
jgi:hypothetical protein